MSLCPGTMAIFCPGTSRDKITTWLAKKMSKKSKIVKKIKIANFLIWVHFFPSVRHPVPGQDGTGCQNPIQACPGPFHGKMSKSCPGPSLDKILSLFHCPFVPGQWRNFCPFVTKSCTVPYRWKPYYLVTVVGLNTCWIYVPIKSVKNYPDKIKITLIKIEFYLNFWIKINY